MYKKASDQQAYMARVASHATKPRGRATAALEDLPVWAREPEEYYRTLRAQWDEVSKRLVDLTHRIQVLKQKLKGSLPFKEFTRTKDELERATALYVATERASGDLRPLIRAAAMNAWGIVYLMCAERLLDYETRKPVNDAVHDILGRSTTDGIGKGRTNWTAEHRHKDNRAEKLRIRRNTFRSWRADKGKIEVRWEKRDGFWHRIYGEEK